MDFFEHQERARRNTARLLIVFAVAVALLACAMYALIAAATNMAEAYAFMRDPIGFSGTPWEARWWRPMLFAQVAAGTAGVLGAATVWKIHSLGDGGISVASNLGGRWVPPETTVAEERRLLNVVEEIAIASGVPVPAVFVLEAEDGINAFAAGNTPSDAAIAVTAGALRLLDREQLQGVIAHEFSHILNGDMRMSLRLIGLLYGFLLLSNAGRALFQGGGRRARHPAFLALALGLVVLGWIGLILGRIVKAAVSRQREYLADAAAVQFTRSTGLARALAAIGGYTTGSRVRTWAAEEMSHLFFANALGWWAGGLFATHPPLHDRIRRIDPSFDGTFPRVRLPETPETPETPGPHADTRPLVPAAPALAPTMDLRPEQVMAGVGSPTPEHLAQGAEIVACVDPALREAVREPLGALGVLYGLLLADDETGRAAQLDALRSRGSTQLAAEVERTLAAVGSLDARARLPLADLTLPALRRLSADQYAAMVADFAVLGEAHQPPAMFAYALQRMLRRRVEPAIVMRRPRATQFYSAKPLLRDIEVLLSALAHVARADTEQAFAAGVAALPPHARAVRLLPAERCTFAAVDRALDRIAQAGGMLRKQLLEACARCALANNIVTVAEAELLRAVAEAIECPLPPFLPAPAPAAAAD
jgi:Zn-dependent protease with chaperone function